MELNTANVTRLMPTRSTELLTECQKLASTRLPDSLRTTLDKVDDALFELANKADSSQRQNQYFDAMRELRLKRESFEANFLSSFNNEFENSIDLEKATHAGLEFGQELELSLVENDDVEESLALTNFVESMRGKCKEQLFGLGRRMGYLMSQPELEDADNPLGPRVIGSAFRSACQQLDSDIEVKLTLYKMFDKFASNGIQELYRDLNAHLVQRDVLPRISASTISSQSAGRGRTRVTIESDDETIEATGPDVFSTLQNLMSNPESAGGIAGMGLGTGGVMTGLNGYAGGAPGGLQGGAATASSGNGIATSGSQIGAGAQQTGIATAPTAHLVDNLTLLQHGDMSGLQASDGAAIDQSAIAAGNVNVLRTIRDTGAIGPVDQTDGLTLDIVSILFDYILDDPAIPDTMKALIGRLQIPMLKVALLDKALFSKKAHPARRFLDRLAGAAVGWSETRAAADDFYDVAESLVRRIVEEFEDDINLIEQALAELEQFLDGERDEAEKRAAESTQSLRTREQIVLAKMEVDDALEECLDGKDMRAFIRQFLLDYWRQLMIITHVEHGKESEIWADQVGTAQDLVWSIQEKASPDERKALTQKLPTLLKNVRRGMATLEMDPPTCSRFLSMLAAVHVVSVKHTEEASLAERHLFHEEQVDEPLIPEDEAQANEERIKQSFSRLFERKGIDTEELDIDLSMFDESDDDDAPPEPEHLSPNIMEYVEHVTELNLGDWVEFDNDDGSTMRARFTWISPSTGRYLFTMRQGEKALDTTLTGLADQFARGVARAITTQPDPIFDRAIGDLMDKLEA